MIDLSTVANLLKENDNFYILTHQYPDGDTLGSGFGLCHALQSIGKKAKVIICGELPVKYSYMAKSINTDNFAPKCIVAVDIADECLLGENKDTYAGKTFLCIDHHGSNKEYAQNIYVDSTAAATAEIIFQLLPLLNVKITTEIADCIYTGICTDTGCFKYSNVTPRTLRMAADLVEAGCSYAKINRVMFDTKSKQRLQIEKAVLNTLKYYSKDRIAIIAITKDLIAQTGAKDDEMDGLASIPRQIEGVKVGITLREKNGGEYKLSVRTTSEINASKLCEAFGGGGHAAAAGCTINGTVESVTATIVKAAQQALNEYDSEKSQGASL